MGNVKINTVGVHPWLIGVKTPTMNWNVSSSNLFKNLCCIFLSLIYHLAAMTKT